MKTINMDQAKKLVLVKIHDCGFHFNIRIKIEKIVIILTPTQPGVLCHIPLHQSS